MQTVREKIEEREKSFLSPLASKSSCTKGRKKYEEPCYLRTEFQRDRDRILHSKAFRRLKHKTQVFFSPYDDHFRTRMTHTLEVSQIARTIARALDLNEDLTEAIALGHDLGHTPFGHSGERVLNELMPDSYKHNEQSVRVVEFIENLNLTQETLDGILNHSYDCMPATLEGQVVRISDKIAYINHDIQDAIRANIIKTETVKIDNKNFTKYTYEDLSKYNDDRQGALGYLYTAKIMPGATFGAKCEHDIDIASIMKNSENNSKEKFFKIEPAQKRLNEAVNIFILVDSCNVIASETQQLLDELFAKTVFE